MKTIDMLGEPCPLPVIKARRALEEEETTAVTVIVDNMVAVQNLEKMANGLGYSFSYDEEDEKHFSVKLSRSGPPAAPIKAKPISDMPLTATAGPLPMTVLFGQDTMGGGKEELGKILMKGFIFSLTELEVPPHTLVFLNSGAYLTAEGSTALEDLQALADKGVRILTCGTCIDFYDLTGKTAVGQVVNMYEIATALSTSGNVVNIG